jgi:hypothetical protein
LKHEIKAHTTRDQATAIAIPGHQDSALSKFEDGLFRELCRQHDRVDLFVSSKADEVSRRLGKPPQRLPSPVVQGSATLTQRLPIDHLSGAIQRLIRKHSDDSAPTDSIKYHRRLIKYERELYQCGDDIHALSRFGNAQIVAFRKIIKKYKVCCPRAPIMAHLYVCNKRRCRLTGSLRIEMDRLYHIGRSVQ